MASSSSSLLPASPNPNSPADADPRSDPSMPSAGDDDDGVSPTSPEIKEEAAAAAPAREKREAPAPAEETPTPRKTRLPRACNSKPKPLPPPPPERPRRRAAAGAAADETPQCRVVTPLVSEPDAPAELPRWRLRGMWELGSVLNFLHVFRPLLNITVEFTAEDLEEALITPSSAILYDVHMPLLKSIPPITRMAMGRGTWVTVLCRKLKDWWHWAAEGDLPIIASHGAETELYMALEPAIRLVILKAICDIRVEQEDIRNYIDSSLKHGYDLATFRKERVGGDSLGISYWYEDDPVLGHRLYREIRRVEQAKEPGKRSRGKRASAPAAVSYQWETVASTFDEFDDVAEKLFSSRNRTEVSLGKKLKIEYLPEIEKIHKKKERLLKKQQREALLLDSYLTSDATTGRSLRDRKPVTYTFDDYDRSINEAIKITKKRENSAEPVTTANKRVPIPRRDASSNGNLNGSSSVANELDDDNSSKSDDYRDSDDEQENGTLDRSNRRRRRSQRYTRDFVEAVSDIDPNFDSDDDIMGEAVYDEEYLRSRKHQKTSSASEEDEEFRLEEDAGDDDEEEEAYSLSTSEDMEEPQLHKKLRSRGRRGAKLKSVDEIQTGLRRSKRSSRPRINYQQYDFSDTDMEAGKTGKSDASDPDANSDAENDVELSTSSQEQEEEDEDGPQELKNNNGSNKRDEDHAVAANEKQEEVEEQQQLPPPQKSVENMDASGRESQNVGRTFLDLNELAPGGGFDDGPSLAMKDEDMDNS